MLAGYFTVQEDGKSNHQKGKIMKKSSKPIPILPKEYHTQTH